MNKFTIEKNIPLPKQQFNGFPFKEMEIGDSFLVREEDLAFRPKNSLRNYIAGLTSKFKRENPSFNFLVKEIKNEGVRVWRIEVGASCR